MRENILGLECVLPDGTIARCGTAALKSSAGYDLTSLMTGSEGTLGVITSVTVKLHPIPEHVMAAKCVFENLKEAAEAVAALKLCNVDLGRCELLDETSIDAFNMYNEGKTTEKIEQMEVRPTIFFEFQGPSGSVVEEQVRITQAICTEDFGGSNFQCASDEEERRQLWSARHSLYYASIALRPGSTGAIVTDVCVPLSKFASLITATAQDVRDLGVVGPCFGHAGDGNFHCILPLLETDTEEHTARIHKVNENLIERTLEAGGTCTGEHGIGYGKMKYLESQYGPGGVQMMRTIKQAIDPLNIMNPGKVIPNPGM
uniref:D-lactate dehydrogenase (cytochrome) n=2 Tax=Cyclophora tenuis TaxID=216820 RepID=A0A7S1DAZ0_CYCTE|mmetsp:Transcript_4084/g.7001  ORF Transcript_4084/g.7001 Transcript_4084/m.7001 type:complete len:316 (+) Transcript_4084:384-1331(+)